MGMRRILNLVPMPAMVAICYPPMALAQATAPAPSPTLEFRFTPTARAQIALWIEKADGTFLQDGTVRLTQSVAYRGIGNRPGAEQMNSGFRWPYGRREGVLPIWAHRRAAGPGAAQFNRVIFQDRRAPDGDFGEGAASRTSVDSTPDSYFCLAFSPEISQKGALDAVSCASPMAFSSDKGRYLTPADTGYTEPAVVAGQGIMRLLPLTSLYPPRRDAKSCHDDGCADTADVAGYDAHARQVMPDIDAVSMATAPAGQEQSILFTVPAGWAGRDYVAWLEVNVEGDYNAIFNAQTYPTPNQPPSKWDYWAVNYGYPYRGQPSVAFTVPFSLGSSGTTTTATPSFYGSVDGLGPDGAVLHPMDANITDDPLMAPGSGADRLRLVAATNQRFQVTVRGTELCQQHQPPSQPTAVRTAPVPNEKHSHQWGRLHFVVPPSDTPIVHYEVRYATHPILEADPSTFERAQPAVAATTDTEALMVPIGAGAGTGIDVDFGGMDPLTHYFVAIRAVDMCNQSGPYAVTELTTTRINFTQLSGCFIATAAYGSDLEPEVDALRRVRDGLRPRSPLFAIATDLYYRSGPAAAAVIARSDLARAAVRAALGSAVALAKSAAPLLAYSRVASASAR